MTRISTGAVQRAEKALKNDGRTQRMWKDLGHWNVPGMFGHIYTSCPVIFREWAGQDYRWVHGNRNLGGLCPVCESFSNRGYFNDLLYKAKLVGEYRTRLQATVDAAVRAEMGLPK